MAKKEKKSPEIDSHIYDQQIFKKKVHEIQQKKKDFTINDAKTKIHM